MKRMTKILGIIAIVAVIAVGFAGCGDGGTPNPCAGGHTWGAWTVTTPPTCVATGTGTRVCTQCATQDSNTTIPKNLDNHDKNYDQVDIEPTCTEKGEGTITCNNEGCDWTDEGELEIDPDNHDRNDEEVTIVPTCVAVGQGKVTCKRDGCNWFEIGELSIDSHNHDTNGAAANCTTAKVCARTGCSVVLQSALGHSFTSAPWQHDASGHWKTCTRTNCTVTSGNGTSAGANASHSYPANNCISACTVCSRASVNSTHSFTSALWQHDASGHWKTCTRTNCTVTSGNGTSAGANVSHSYPTSTNCTSPCPTCSRASVNSTHNFTVFVSVTTPATCTASGQDTNECSRCAVTGQITKAALGHSNINTDQTAKATGLCQREFNNEKCEALLYKLGDTGPGGGLIFYVADGGEETRPGIEHTRPNGFTYYTSATDNIGKKAHYLEVALTNALGGDGFDTEMRWNMGIGEAVTNLVDINIGNGSNPSSSQMRSINADIGMGSRNTARIITFYSTHIIYQNQTYRNAARAAYGPSNGWFLPSIGELYWLHQNREHLNGKEGFSVMNTTYWSSSQSDTENAWSLYAPSGNLTTRLKYSNNYSVRAVRAF